MKNKKFSPDRNPLHLSLILHVLALEGHVVTNETCRSQIWTASHACDQMQKINPTLI